MTAKTPERMTDGAVVRLLVSQAPSLSTEQARDYAGRWAFWASPDLPPVGGDHPPCLTDSEHGQLYAWVRAWVLEEGDLSQLADPRHYLTERLGLALDIDSDDISHAEYLDRAWALIDAADGWPS